jgi:putative transposase
VRRTLPPSAEIEAQIDQLLAVGVGENPRQSLSELAKLGARLIIQRAVEDEFDAWLGRARYERRPDYQRGLRNFDSGLRTATAHAACRPQRESSRSRSRRCARPRSRSSLRSSRTRRSCFAPSPWRRWSSAPSSEGCRCETSSRSARRLGLGKLSKSTASRICTELRERFEAFKRRDLYQVKLVALFLDAIFLNVRPKGPKEGVLCAWGSFAH